MTPMNPISLPPMPLADWDATRTYLHLCSQIVGKVRLALAPRTNHWWHAPFYLTARGLSTSPIPYGDRLFECEFDFTAHTLRISTSDGRGEQIPLGAEPVAGFYRSVQESLSRVGVTVKINPQPFDPARVRSDIPFHEDTTHDAYDREQVARFWRVLVEADSIFKVFRGRFLGKCSPVHFFWHSFDLAVTRFSGRRAPVAAEADPVTRDAYSHEVISAGFWFGDDHVPQPAFYTYVHPEPEGLAEEPLLPDPAAWHAQNGTHMALLLYDHWRMSPDPRAAALEFLESAYVAGAKRASWPRSELDYTTS